MEKSRSRSTTGENVCSDAVVESVRSASVCGAFRAVCESARRAALVASWRFLVFFRFFIVLATARIEWVSLLFLRGSWFAVLSVMFSRAVFKSLLK